MMWSPPLIGIICHKWRGNVKEETTMNINIIGIDLAKNVFHLIEIDKTAKKSCKKN